MTQQTYELVVSERDQLDTQRRDLETRLERLEAANTSLGTEREVLLDAMEDERIAKGQLEVDVRRLSRSEAELSENLQVTSALLAARSAEIQRMRGTYDALVSDLQEEVATGQIQIERLKSGLVMNLSQEILFASGSSNVNPGGAAVLRKVAAQLTELAYDVAVIGHTDDVPIAAGYPSNWELAGARASSVVRLLAAAGVAPARLSAVSRGEYDPIASNDDPQGRSINRRIEIWLEPVAAPVGPDLEPAGADSQPDSAEPSQS